MGEECNEYRCWEELLPDALGLIFRNLSLQEVLTVVPRVCKSWNRVVSGPYCWQEIDIDEWCQRNWWKSEKLTRMVHMLIARSGGSFSRFSVSALPNDTLFASLQTSNARSLKTFELPRSDISDCIVEDVAQRLSNVTFLDVSSCTKIGARALEAFGKNCRSLERLWHVMHPMDVDGKDSQHDEARAIAYNMRKLRHLEIGYMLIATEDVVEIASQCHDLKFLDVRGCWYVDNKLLEERYPWLKVQGPLVDGFYEDRFWEEYSDDSDDDSIYSSELIDDDYYVIGSDEEEAIWDDGQDIE
ncbi:hypothetical protein BRADI_1g57260v3 [Brachypodium distachyon]|uniref:F-box domain-containing protein n=1 Tax=Brachypodium distachyon TaxID=15368 RepID=A0A0Q3NTT0_BRADI|nr:hypothetical protein BRADI_1g57260v3 [Brachypodium distachyon]